MKKLVQKYITALDGSSEYSGKTNTLFINDPKELIYSIEYCVSNTFFNLPFKLVTND